MAEDVEVSSGTISFKFKTFISIVVGLLFLGINIGGFAHLQSRVEVLEAENKTLKVTVLQEHATQIALIKSDIN